MNGLLRRAPLLMLLLALLAACSGTDLKNAWKNPDYQQRLGKVYIVGIAQNENVRRAFEDEFGRQFQARGATAIASYRDLASPADADQQAVAERIQANGADSVLMARVLSRRVEEVVSTSGSIGNFANENYSRSFGRDYANRFDAVYNAPLSAQFEIVTIEANLYEAKSGTLIWMARLETLLDANLDKMVADFVKAVTADLHDKQLL